MRVDLLAAAKKGKTYVHKKTELLNLYNMNLDSLLNESKNI